MKNRKQLLLRIVAGTIAMVMIGGILFVTNAFTGNPISGMSANRAIQKYITENYSFLDLEVADAKYDFKDGAYVARAESKTSIDTKFNVYYRNGKVIRDDYEGSVLNKFNTWDRLSNEFSSVAKKIVAEELNYENTTMVIYDDEAMDELELDMEFDKKLPINAEVVLRLDLKDDTLETITETLINAHNAFVENECYFTKYGLYSENNGTNVMVNGVTPADIESGNLLNLLESAKNGESTSELSISINKE